MTEPKEGSLRDTDLMMSYVMIDQETTTSDRIYEWTYNFIGSLLVFQLLLGVVAVALALPVLGTVLIVLQVIHWLGV